MKINSVGCRFLFLLAGVVCTFPLYGQIQKSNIWQSLLKISWTQKVSPQLGVEIDYPIFTPAVKAFNGKEVQITGYVLPMIYGQNYVALSAYPNASCFFCGGAGIESIVEVYPIKNRTYKPDEIVTFKGKFKLNDTDVDHLIYLLEKAEEIEIPK